MKQLVILILTLLMFALLCSAQEDSGGNHNGEVENLILNFEYSGYAYINSMGYPVYFASLRLVGKTHIKNASPRTYKKLTVRVSQEYNDTGELLPGASTAAFTGVTLGPGEEIILTINYDISTAVEPGICRTHLVIKHWNQGTEDPAMILSLPICGLFEVQ